MEPPIKPQPLWIRVDENRVKLAVFVVLFVVGSAILLTATMVALPGFLLGWGASQGILGDPEWYPRYVPWIVLGSFVLMLVGGALVAAVQLSNAEDWVRNRFKGRPLPAGEAPRFESAVNDMAVAAGLAQAPQLILIPSASVNAFAIGARTRPYIGVTQGLLDAFTEDEERAVIATLMARIVAGDIMFGTALAALMGPIKAIRSGGKGAVEGVGEIANAGANTACSGCGNTDVSGCTDGCSGCGDAGGCLSDVDTDGCGGLIVAVLFIALVAALTYVAVVTAAWIVTLWGRALHRTAYEKADAEGMLLLRDPTPMLSALKKASTAENTLLEGDSSYDSIFYTSVSGDAAFSRTEKRRFRRLAEVLGVEGAMADAGRDA